ncbi:MAG: hypothetical protein ABJX32_08275, partial [Tateyamaria sp.]|uniref:hypothetical protein n=1 Tax=Tateyamaria sp. TaxID=1929288 RepID=UPI00329F32C1
SAVRWYSGIFFPSIEPRHRKDLIFCVSGMAAYEAQSKLTPLRRRMSALSPKQTGWRIYQT